MKNNSLLEQIIEWVNSFDYPDCLIASDLEDFRNGIILCELVHELFPGYPDKLFFSKIITENLNKNSCVSNIALALQVIKSSVRGDQLPDFMRNSDAAEIFRNEQKLYDFLEYLYREHTKKTEPGHMVYVNNRNIPSGGMSSERTKEKSLLEGLTAFAEMGGLKINSNSATKLNMPKKISGMQESPQRKQNEFHFSLPSHDLLTRSLNFPKKETHGDLAQVEPDSKGKRNGSPENIFSVITKKRMENPEKSKQPDEFKDSNNKNQVAKPKTNLQSPIRAAIEQRLLQAEIKKSQTSSQERKAGLNYSIRSPQSLKGQSMKTDFENSAPRKPEESNRKPEESSSNKQEASRQASDLKAVKSSSANKGVLERSLAKYSAENFFPSPNSGLAGQPSLMASPEVFQHLSKRKDTLATVTQETWGSDFPTEERIDLDKILKKKENPSMTFEYDINYPLTSLLKQKLIKWMESILLLRENQTDLEERLPKICVNGVIFSDLINRVEHSKIDIVKGIEREAKTKAQMITNYNKLFAYLKKFDRMNPRFFFSAERLMNGDPLAFWGLLDDLWHFYNHKVSPYDMRYNMKNERAESDITFNEQLKSTSKSWKSGKKGDESDRRKDSDPNPYEEILFNSVKRRKPKGYKLSIDTGRMSTLQSVHTDINKNSINESSTTPIEQLSPHNIDADSKPRFATPQKKSNLRRPSPCGRTSNTLEVSFKEPITKEVEMYTRTWLKTLGFGNFSLDKNPKSKERTPVVQEPNALREINNTKSIGTPKKSEEMEAYEHPLRNGTLLCFLVSRMELGKIDGIYRYPKNMSEVKKNFQIAYSLLRLRFTEIPYEYLWKTNDLINGDYDTTWGLLYHIMKAYEKCLDLGTIRLNGKLNSSFISQRSVSSRKAKENLQLSPSNINNTLNNQTLLENSNFQDFSKFLLPYNETELRDLEEALFRWIRSLNIFGSSFDTKKPNCFNDLIDDISKGVLLSDIVSSIFGEKVLGVLRKPVGEANCRSNIRKVLFKLKGNSSIRRKFLDSDKEIYEQRRHVILGLLEDIMNFARSKLCYDLNNSKFSISPQNRSYYRGIGPNIEGSEFLVETRSKELTSKKSEDDNKPKTANFSPQRSTENSKDCLPFGGLVTLKSPSNISNFDLLAQYSSYRSKQSYPSFSPSKSARNFNQDKPRGNEESRLAQSNLETSERKERRSAKDEKFVLEDARRIEEWLLEIDFGDFSKNINFHSSNIEALRDGVFLCKLLEKLELHDIQGIEYHPKTIAGCLVNLRKALKILRAKKDMNPKFLFDEELFYQGDGQVWREVLLNMRNAYRFTYKYVSKTKDQIKKQREKWLAERELERNMGKIGITKEDLQAQPNGAMLSELTMKLTEKLKSELQKDAPNNQGFQQNIQMEKTISKEIETNTCSICYELMVPPTYSPIILFPCGHTLCRACVYRGTKIPLPKCPLCRNKVQSSAVNISLQNLICVFTNNKHLIDKYNDEIVTSNKPEEKTSNETIDTFKENLKLCSLRCKILESEKKEIDSENVKLLFDLDCNNSALEKLYKRRHEIREAIKKLESEQSLVEEFINQNEGVVSDIENQISQNKTKIGMITETLAPLAKEREKYEFLIQATQKKKY